MGMISLSSIMMIISELSHDYRFIVLNVQNVTGLSIEISGSCCQND